jgi:hypothetical protein
MIGSNELKLNPAEMMKAVQFYLRERVFGMEYGKNVVVSDVEVEGQGGSYKTYVVKLVEAPANEVPSMEKVPS